MNLDFIPMILKTFKQGDDVMTYLNFLTDHLGYWMDNGLEETVPGNDGRRTGGKTTAAWNRLKMDAT